MRKVYALMSTASQVTISVDAPGKVNLYLAVGDVRQDGYHPLTTLFAAVSLLETITVSEGQAPGLKMCIRDSPYGPDLKRQKPCMSAEY